MMPGECLFFVHLCFTCKSFIYIYKKKITKENSKNCKKRYIHSDSQSLFTMKKILKHSRTGNIASQMYQVPVSRNMFLERLQKQFFYEKHLHWKYKPECCHTISPEKTTNVNASSIGEILMIPKSRSWEWISGKQNLEW